MLNWCVTATLLLGMQAGAGAAPKGAAKGDASAQLKERCSKIPTSGTYAFESKVESEGGGGFGPGGARGGGDAGGRAGPRTDSTAGKVEIGKAAELKRDETIAIRTGDKLVYKKGETWEVYTPPDFGGGGFGGGPPGGAPPGGGPPGGGRAAGGGGGGEGDMRERFRLMGLANMPMPHALIASIDAKLKDVTASESGGKWTFSGTLTEAGADEISGLKAMRERFGGAGGAGAAGGAPQMSASGAAAITFAADGSLEQVVFETKTTTPRGESKRKQTIAFSEWGKAKVEVPKAAAEKLTG
jgi:hypothetical protein